MALGATVARKMRARWRGAFSRRSAPLLVGDLVLALLALVVAHALRLGPVLDDRQAWLLLQSAPLFLASCCAVFIASGLYTIDWRFATLVDMLRIPRAVLAAAGAHLSALFLIDRLQSASRVAVVISVFVMVALLIASRLAFRADEVSLTLRAEPRPKNDARLPVALVGGGAAADGFLRALRREPQAPYHAVGIIDSDPARVGLTMHRVPILGTIEDARTVLDALATLGAAPRRLIFTEDLPRFRDGAASALINLAEERGIAVSRLPRATELRDPRRSEFDLRPIELTDLLERTQATLPGEAVARVIARRAIAVTGAGGSIGSELCAQIAAIGPSEIVLIENCEYNLYAIDLLLKKRFPAVRRAGYICDVRDRGRVDDIFARHRPEIVFHAAALKHVPLVELNPAEGVLTNVIGSRNVAEAARATGALAMVQISTDKAVNSCNVMGATKRIAELFCQALDIAGEGAAPATRFMTVRFGNVLGSSGSLIPLFQRQLAEGGPLTVTHPDMTRYFMTIREAVQLTLQSSAEGLERQIGRGRIFVLDMGRPIRVIDIARRMIRLAGLTPDRDIGIEFIGLRPGEKLFEELFDAKERRSDSRIEGVMCAEPTPAPLARIERAMTILERAAKRNDVDTLLQTFRGLVDGYEPSPEAQAAAKGGFAHQRRVMAPMRTVGGDAPTIA